MDKPVSREVYRSFRNSSAFLAELGGEAIGTAISAGSDVALIVSPAGRILDVSFRDRSFVSWGLDHWAGKEFADTVTVESREKVRDLLREAGSASMTRARQVNHAVEGGDDLPVSYRLISFKGQANRLALGSDMRGLSEMQQRLVRAQIEMEKDYRKIRDVESRYRILFQLATEPLLVIDSQNMKVVDANEGVARLLSRPVKKILGVSIASAFAKGEQAAAIEALTSIAINRREDVFQARVATVDKPMSIRATPFREFGKTNLLICFLDDRTGASLSQAPGLLSVARSIPDGMVVVDEGGLILEANSAFLDLIRVVGPDRVEGKALDTWLGGSVVDLQVLMANLREHGSMRRFSSIVRDDLGGSEAVEVSATRIGGGERPTFGFAIRETMRSEPLTEPLGARGAMATQFTDMVGRVPLKDLVRDTADVIEKLCIEAALKLTDNNRASAADMLGLSRQSLYIKLRRYGFSDVDQDNERQRD